MLARIAVSASIALFVATQAPALLASNRTPQNAAVAASIFTDTTMSTTNQALLQVSDDGHYSGDFIVNGRIISGIVDTGATFVALSEVIAQNSGIQTDNLQYDYTVATAAGDVKAARVTLKYIEIGEISIIDVDALVIRDIAFSQTLIGMSFLGRLSSYSVAGGMMRLVR